MKFMTTKKEFRSSKELLTEVQKSGRKFLLGRKGSNSIKETCAAKGKKKNVIHTGKRKLITIAATFHQEKVCFHRYQR